MLRWTTPRFEESECFCNPKRQRGILRKPFPRLRFGLLRAIKWCCPIRVLTLLIVLMTIGCGGADEVVMPENPTPLPPEDVMTIGTGSATDGKAAPPPLPTPE